MNTAHTFNSILGNQIDRFLAYHRALGKQFDSEQWALRLLDRYIADQPDVVEIEHITPALVNQFLLSRPRTNNRSYNHLLNVLQRLFRWLIVQQVLIESPVKARPRSTRQQRIPYLFERSEVEQLLDLAAQLPDAPHAHRRGMTYRMIFALMYSLGLRVGEVANLCRKDVVLDDHYLHIRQTKFSKSRLVPFGPRLAIAIEQYLERCPVIQFCPDDPVFSLSRDCRKPIRSHSISCTFRSLLDVLDLQVPPGVSAPRLHCLRHTFAVSTLVRWYRSGIDPAKKLMYLSAFMGHVNPSSTVVYLTITTELLELANERFEAYAAPTLPGVSS